MKSPTKYEKPQHSLRLLSYSLPKFSMVTYPKGKAAVWVDNKMGDVKSLCPLMPIYTMNHPWEWGGGGKIYCNSGSLTCLNCQARFTSKMSLKTNTEVIKYCDIYCDTLITYRGISRYGIFCDTQPYSKCRYYLQETV